MTFHEIIMSNMLFSSMPKINSGYILLDTMYFIAVTSIFYYVSNFNFQNGIFKNLFEFNKANKLVFTFSNKKSSKRFRAIMYFISKKNDISIKKLIEDIDTKYSHTTDSYEETKQTGYRVDQTTKFLIDKDIYGKVYYREKEVINDFGKSNFDEIIYLEIFSNNISLLKLQNWVDTKLKDYDTHIKSKITDKQLLVEINWNHENKNVNVNYHPWESNVTFDNRFFSNKDNILEKINFFINNQEWYKERGIPWTLGFLLWGKPGCGKTGFIKALMNATKRSAITVKLNNKFNLDKLKRIIYDDEINEELIIPQKNRIIIFEDIDCMGDIVIDRDHKDNEKIY
jgi:ATP-dependent 26S proteasome regulatory subunit